MCEDPPAHPDELRCECDADSGVGDHEHQDQGAAVSLYVLAISGAMADGLCSGPSRRGTRDSTVDGEEEEEGTY